ncbi:MAG: zinc ABC transporter substrate-binding protein [Planctomycetales bacterium]|nr:zinc ABC transporter substrate-binding protein [Planctomycetales bacterium]
MSVVQFAARNACAAILSIAVLSANGFSADGNAKRFVAFCSTTQVADFVRQVGGTHWEVQCVLVPGEDPHLYETTPEDALAAGKADLCFENGWHLEGGDWMKTLAKDKGKRLVTCLLGVEPLMVKDGDDERKAYDPHAWFSPRNAVRYVENIRTALCEFDSDHADEYNARADLYRRQLAALDGWIRQEINKAIPVERRILVTSHDAFNYFCQAYSFKSASPVGWSTGQEIGGDVTFAKKQAAIDSIRKFGVKAIFVETSVNKALINEIAKEAGVTVGGELYSDSMGEPGTGGETYIGMMRENVLTIVGGLK